MRRFLALLCAGLLIASAPLRAADSAPTQTATITVHAEKTGVKISPVLYGIFYEEINHAGDGGIYAEMVQNRAFEETQPAVGARIENNEMVTPNGYKHKLWYSSELQGWSPVADGGASVTLALDDAEPLNARTPHSMRVEIKATGARAGVANSGYWGMGIKEGESYELSFYARSAAGYASTLTATLENSDGAKCLAKATVENVGGAWKRYACSLAANATNPNARLTLTLSQPGTLWFDVVSLFPRKTFKNRPNGLREDIAQSLVALKPAFLRFPGGCVVEGVTLQNRIQWKNTIGDIAQRPGRWDLWGYHNTEGLGYHEYLQMGEDLGVELMYVISAGLSCQYRKAEIVSDPAQLKEYVQDTLDALEYAMGPVTSKWGAERAKNGHPEPFKIKYVEIGNENKGEQYYQNYRVYYDAIKARYPDVITISDYNAIPKAMTEIIDEHYYVKPDVFFNKAALYDNYNRNGPKIYVGEYAVNKDVGSGNLYGALAEAAFMIGMERNSDVVVMASYAPLFENVNDRRWPVNLIRFDSARCCGRTSYHVQSLFNNNRPDVTLETEVNTAINLATATRYTGAVGLGTWNTKAEFKDVKVMQGEKVLVADDFSKWKVISGDWKVQDGVFRQSGLDQPARAVIGDLNWKDYVFTFKARKTDGAEGFLTPFLWHDDNNSFFWNVGGWLGTQHGIARTKNGNRTLMTKPLDGKIETGRWYDVQISVRGGKIECSLDGKVLQSVALEAGGPRVFALGGRDEKTGQIVIKAVNATADALATTFKITGAPNLKPNARVLTLSGEKEDENTLDEPAKVVPVASTFDGVAPEFTYTLKPYSLTLLRLETR